MENPHTRYHWSDSYLAILLKCEILRANAFYESGRKSQLENFENGIQFDLDQELKKIYEEKALATVYAYRMLADQGLRICVTIKNATEETRIISFKNYLDMLESKGTEHPDMTWYPPNFTSFEEYQEWFLDCFKEEHEKVSVTA